GVHVLDHRVGGARRMDPPERRDQVWVERLEADRLTASRGVTGVGDRTRDLRPLELVAEDRRGLPDRRFPREKRQHDERRDGVRNRREEAVETRRALVHSLPAPSTTRGSRSTSRRTKRHVTWWRSAARTITSSRS